MRLSIINWGLDPIEDLAWNEFPLKSVHLLISDPLLWLELFFPSTLLASVIVFYNEEGTSCKSICEKIISSLEETDVGYKYIKGILIAYNDISAFTDNCFDEGMTINNIQFYEPDFNELPLTNAPIWLKGGKLKISMDALKLSNTIWFLLDQ